MLVSLKMVTLPTLIKQYKQDGVFYFEADVATNFLKAAANLMFMPISTLTTRYGVAATATNCSLKLSPFGRANEKDVQKQAV